MTRKLMTRQTRQKHNRRKRTPAFLRPLLAAAALGAGFLAPAAHAGGAVYQQHLVNAGVLVNGAGTDPAPYLFYVLNNRPDVRPPDLTFVNPLAPAAAAPTSAAYWEVSLNDVSDSELSRYNVLYLAASYQPAGGGATVQVPFSPAVNEKLRRFVDGGGQLIVEYDAAAAPAQGLFTGSGAASPAATTLTLPSAGVGMTLVRQPIVSQPYLLSPSDLAGLAFVAPEPYLQMNAADTQHAAEFATLFSPAVIDTNAHPLVSTAQIGAGQVIVSSLNFGGVISGHNGAAFQQTDLAAAPAVGLKLLSNIVTYAEAHPNGNKTSHGNASSTGLASFSPAWQFPVQSSGTVQPPPGAAIWGNFVFVTDATGTLRAFDAYPSESLLGGAMDDGIADYSNSPGTSYDEIWRTGVGSYASAPTVASFGGINYVFVELRNGSVVYFNAVTGVLAATLTPLTTTTTPALPPPYTATSYTTNAPAPTFYDGRVYAGQANGTLAVYDLNEPATYFVPLNPTPPTGIGAAEPVTGSPAVGLLAGGDASVLTAVVPTQYNMYSVLLGARNEPLRAYTVGGVQNGYSINRSGRYDVANLFADVPPTAVPAPRLYDAGGVDQGINAAASAFPQAQDPLFMYPSVGSYFTDWNMDFKSAVTSGGGTSQVNLNSISAFSYGQVNNTPTSGATAMSAPAIDRHGNAYYTETNGANSYVVAVGTAALHSNVRLNFRFRIPSATDNVTYAYKPATGLAVDWTYKDADNVDYSPLVGFQFFGAPVVDDQGNVYAVATNGTISQPPTLATVLCFRGNQQVSAVFDLLNPAVDLTTTTISQPDEDGSDENSIFRGPDTNVGAANATYGQFIGSPSSLTFYNFGKRGSTFSQIAGSLTEPQPVFATDTLGTGTKTPLLMRTNLAWYVTPFRVNINRVTGLSNVMGLSQVGSSLFLSDGASLFRLSTKPTVGTGRVVTTPPVGVPLGAGGLGTVGAPPSVGGSVMIVNGSAGIEALTRQITVIADSGRVMGVDGDGGAVWAVDATTRTDAVSQTATKVAFSHPAALSQFALNDYLAADTGNNRCVRFDSGGNVLWELTRFSDPDGILAAGQPLTLSQPSSVVVRANVPLPASYPLYPNGTATYYLVADSGNNRVLEVADIVDSGGILHSHILTWATHTGDRNGRSYRYGSAAYYPNPTPLPGKAPYSIAATVVNTQIGALAAGGPGPVSGDAPGGSIAVFNPPVLPQAFNATSNPASDLAYVAAGFYAANASGGYTPFTVRNPRFLQLYTPPTGTGVTVPNAIGTPFDFLYADDNGAFDLSYDTMRHAFVAGPDRLHFTGTDYQGMGLTAFGVGTVSRTYLPFTATAVQGLSSDSQSSGGTTSTVRRYLITQSHSQGELSSAAAGKIGGEVFEVDVNATSGPSPTATSTPVGGFSGGETLAHPALAGPLIQPTDALRLP